MQLKGWIIILAGSLFFTGMNAQQISVDSVKNQIETRPDDTLKVIHYRIVSGLLRLTNPTEGVKYGLNGADLGKRLQFDKGTAGCYLNVSVCYSNRGSLDSALVAIDSAIVYSHLAGDMNRLALAYLNRADYNMQLQYFEQALRDCDTSMVYADLVNNDDRRARVFQTIGSIYFFQEKYPATIAYYKRADSLYHKLGNMQMSAIVQNNLALVYKNTGDYTQAVSVLKKAIGIADSLQDLSNLSMYHGTLSDAYYYLNELTLAERHADLSMEHAVRIDNKSSMADAWHHRGLVYVKQGKIKKGIDASIKAFEMSSTSGDLTKMATISGDLAEAYALAGNHKEAYSFLKIHSETTDSLAKKRYDEDIAALQTRFHVGEKDKEIQLLNKDNLIHQTRISRQRTLFLSTLALIVFGFAGIALYISRYRLKNRMKEMELRQRIAADLHDEVGSSLSSIHMLSQIASHQPGSNQGNQILQRLSQHARETMDKMSDIVWMIKPEEHDSLSLKQRIEQLAYELTYSQSIDITTDLNVLEKEKLTPDQRRNIYLIFKEAVNNALKYSLTEKIDIHAAVTERELRLRIRDYGTGMELSVSRKGNGLGNMEKRAHAIGGRLLIESKPGNGTTVEVVAPI